MGIRKDESMPKGAWALEGSHLKCLILNANNYKKKPCFRLLS